MFENKEQAAVLLKALDGVAYALHNFCVKGMEIFGEVPAPTETPPAVAPPASAAQTEAPANEETPSVALTEDDVRKVLTKKTHEGFSARIKEILPKYGATKLSDIPAENYAALMAEVEALS